MCKWGFLLAIIFMSACLSGSAYASATVFFVDDLGGLYGVIRPDVSDPVSAVAALASPGVDYVSGKQLTSAIPSGTTVLDLRVDGNTTIVDFSGEILSTGLDEEKLATIYRQVSRTLAQFGLDTDVLIMADGTPLYKYLPGTPSVSPTEQGTASIIKVGVNSLSGKKITVSPGHGKYWTGSGWSTQRPAYCAPLNEEDYHNLEMCQYLETYLLNDGATVKMVRCTNKNYGNSPWAGGSPWWQMAACYWLKQIGYPCSVYGSYSGCSLGDGASEVNDDIRARPLASDYDNSDIYVSLHTNGYAGDCWSGCPTGTETYYDASDEHAPWGAISQTLATKINNGIMDAIQGQVDASWSCHGACVKNSNGAYGEIRIPDRAATLTELAFHDSCNYDANSEHLRDNFFRSAAMWGMYKGICEYFNKTPTYGFYSAELVSEDIPTAMEAAHQYTIHITFRNKGVLWKHARGYRLGAVGDSDPFTTQIRHGLSSEVGPNETYTFTFVLTAPNCGGTYVTDWQMMREGYTWFGPIVSKTIEVTGPPDVDPPSVPQNVLAESISTSQVEISWSASTDNVGVTGYRIYRNGSPLTTTTSTSYTDTGLSSNTTYTYTVSAYDAVWNESSQSAPSATITHTVVFQDGFPNMNYWPADVVADGTTRGLLFYTDEHHGTYSGIGAALTQPGSTSNQGSFAYRALPDTFATGSFDCWFFDTGGVDDSNQGIHVRGFNGSTLVFSAYLGTYPPSARNAYSGAVYDGSTWFWAPQLATRSIAWRHFKIMVGTSEIKFYVDGVKKGSLPRPANVDTFGFSRVNLGREYNVACESLFDDAQFTASGSTPPVMNAPTALSTTSIRWNFTDSSNNETGFRLHDASHNVKGTAGRNASFIDESGLSPNTQYTRHVHARNGTIEGPPSASASCYTLSVPPSTSTVTCDKPASVWLPDSEFTFTAVGGFGPGKVEYYRYAWDQSPTHTWTGSEPQWGAGNLNLSATVAGDWYLHVKGYNGEGVENGTLDLGPYKYAPVVETISAAKNLPNGTALSLVDKVVTGDFDEFFYIQENGTSGNNLYTGLRIDGDGPAPGVLCTVSGVLSLADGERRITDANVVTGSSGTIPEPAFLSNRYIGGGALNAWTPGLPGRLDVNNVGLLVVTSGKISAVDSGFIYVDDGSVPDDGTGHAGIRVDTSRISGPFNVDDYVVIRGISSTCVDGVTIIPIVRPRDNGDRVIYHGQ